MKKLILKLVVCLGVALALAGAAVLSSAQSSEFKIVVHADNPTTSLTSKDVSNFLLKKKTRWSDNFRETVSPIDLHPSSQIRESFSQAIHRRSVASIKNYWQRQIFSGENVPPPEVSNDAAVLAHVRGNRGAIGYVSAGAQLSGVKVITVAN